MITMTKDKELSKSIIKKLNENLEKYGERYCPCVPHYLHTKDSICMCKEFRDMKEGNCHCGLFIKVKD